MRRAVQARVSKVANQSAVHVKGAWCNALQWCANNGGCSIYVQAVRAPAYCHAWCWLALHLPAAATLSQRSCAQGAGLKPTICPSLGTAAMQSDRCRSRSEFVLYSSCCYWCAYFDARPRQQQQGGSTTQLKFIPCRVLPNVR